MIVLDTHVWVWWVHGGEQLTQAQREIITANETDLFNAWLKEKLLEQAYES